MSGRRRVPPFLTPEPRALEPSTLLAQAADAALVLPPWITTATYLWLAIACVWAWRAGKGPGGRLAATTWLALAAIFLALAAARTLGLQAKLTGTVRELAREEGWYYARREVQARVVLAAAALASLAPAAIAVHVRSTRMILALSPIAALLGFLAVRAVSLHQVDAVLYRRVGGFEVNTMVELTLLTLVAAGLGVFASGGRGNAPGAAVPPRDDHLGARRYRVR